MSCKTAPQRPCLMAGEVRNFKVGFIDELDSGELLTGTPTVTEQVSSDLTITNVAVNTAELPIDGTTHAIGQAVTFKVTGQSATGGENSDGVYELIVQCATDATVPQTLKTRIYFETEAV